VVNDYQLLNVYRVWVKVVSASTFDEAPNQNWVIVIIVA